MERAGGSTVGLDRGPVGCRGLDVVDVAAFGGPVAVGVGAGAVADLDGAAEGAGEAALFADLGDPGGAVEHGPFDHRGRRATLRRRRGEDGAVGELADASGEGLVADEDRDQRSGLAGPGWCSDCSSGELDQGVGSSLGGGPEERLIACLGPIEVEQLGLDSLQGRVDDGAVDRVEDPVEDPFAFERSGEVELVAGLVGLRRRDRRRRDRPARPSRRPRWRTVSTSARPASGGQQLRQRFPRPSRSAGCDAAGRSGSPGPHRCRHRRASASVTGRCRSERASSTSARADCRRGCGTGLLIHCVAFCAPTGAYACRASSSPTSRTFNAATRASRRYTSQVASSTSCVGQRVDVGLQRRGRARRGADRAALRDVPRACPHSRRTYVRLATASRDIHRVATPLASDGFTHLTAATGEGAARARRQLRGGHLPITWHRFVAAEIRRLISKNSPG